MLVSWVLHLRLCHMAPVKAKSIFQEMWFFCTIWHEVPLMCTSNLAPTAYSFEANYQLIWELILCHLHIESRTVLYTSLAEKVHHFHGAFALCVRFPVKVFSITMCLQFISLTEFDPQVTSYVCGTIDTLRTNELDRDMQLHLLWYFVSVSAQQYIFNRLKNIFFLQFADACRHVWFVRLNWSFHSKHCYTTMQECWDITRVSVLQLCTMKSGPLHMLVSLEMHYSR
jgi:hypothetical protein